MTRLTQQLTMLFLRHALATLLYYGTQEVTSTIGIKRLSRKFLNK